MDSRIACHPQLRDALADGLNHIPLTVPDFDTTLDILTFFARNVTEHIQRCFSVAMPSSSTIDQLVFDYTCSAWPDVLQQCRTDSSMMQHTSLWDMPAIKTELHHLLDNLYIAPTDKATANATYMCKHLARYKCYIRLHDSGDFTQIQDVTPDELIARMQDEVSRLIPELPAAEPALPYIFLYFKAHKLSFRFLTNGSSMVLSNLTQLAATAGQCVLQQLKEYCGHMNERIAEWTGGLRTQTFWVVPDAVSTVLNLPKDQPYSSDLTADIEKCFEAIPIDLDASDGLHKRLSKCIDWVFDHYAATHHNREPDMHITLDHRDSTATAAKLCHTKPTSKYTLTISRQKLKDMNAYIMQHAYVQLGDQVYRQTTGIPMGFHVSPDWTNLYLASYEVEAVLRVCRHGSSQQRQQFLPQFERCYRLMDDLRAVNAPDLSKFLSASEPREPHNLFWIYPPCLSIKNTIAPEDALPDMPGNGSASVYLNIKTQQATDGSMQHRMYHKAEALPFPVTRGVKYQSNRPVLAAYKSIIGNAVTAVRLASDSRVAIKSVAELMQQMASNGFNRSKLIKVWLSYVKKQPSEAASWPWHHLWTMVKQ
jgi:hypothetical protein